MKKRRFCQKQNIRQGRKNRPPCDNVYGAKKTKLPPLTPLTEI